MRRIAIADIHGCLITFRSLIEDTIGLKKEDILYLLGDYINKGPDSKGVLDYIFQLQEKKYQIECIRGNHDQMLLEWNKEGIKRRWEEDEELLITLKSFDVKTPDQIPEKYLSFIDKLPYYVEINDFILVHAGLNVEVADPFEDYNAMLNIRETKLNNEINKRIIHGHTPVPVEVIKQLTAHQSDIINIDAGCSNYKKDAYGNMVGLDLDTMQLFVERYKEV